MSDHQILMFVLGWIGGSTITTIAVAIYYWRRG
jgi:hypothetical protein